MSEQAIWRLVAGQKKGPYPPARLRPLVLDGRIGTQERFSYDGISWSPIGAFPELLHEPTPLPEETYTVNLEEEEPFVPLAQAGKLGRDDTDRGLLVAVYVVVGAGMFFVLVFVILTFGSMRS